MMERRVNFYSGGNRLQGIFRVPDSVSSDRPAPGIVCCQGFTAPKEANISKAAVRLADAGFVVLTFDYRGTGESDGIRRIFPLEQVEDIQNALSFLNLQAEVRKGSLGLYGHSLGASHALYTAAIDQRVKGVAWLNGIADGGSWLRSLRRAWEWNAFARRMEQDQERRLLTGEGQMVDPLEIMLPDPDSVAFMNYLYETWPGSGNPLPLECAERIIGYQPVKLAAQISPRPLVIAHAGNDDFMATDNSRAVYEAAKEPKRLIIFEGTKHFDAYLGTPFERFMQAAIEMFRGTL